MTSLSLDYLLDSSQNSEIYFVLIKHHHALYKSNLPSIISNHNPLKDSIACSKIVILSFSLLDNYLINFYVFCFDKPVLAQCRGRRLSP